MENVIRSRVIGRDFRITSTPSGLWIEVLDSDIEPIRLTQEHLAEFGLQLANSQTERDGLEPACNAGAPVKHVTTRH
jgi:hypothetical protein